ncbi:MAG: hypothetical protein GXP02_09555 [Alphaproteobacteria bacterium]|nr:hypothetical protein [Alphaproteobacteria bacterium]
MDNSKPQMLGDQYYKEYWEQNFIFDDGTFVTSQFLVANFPWPVGKKHGIMIATVVRPDGQRLIIKNGRNLGGWGFDPKKFNIFIYTHRLSSKGDKDVIHLGTVGQDVIDITGKSAVAPLDHKRFSADGGYMDSSFYLPYFNGEGRWKIRWDKKQPFVTGAGRVQGFGTHVLFTGKVETLLKSWLRVRGLRQKDRQSVPFLSSIQRPNGSRDIIFTLKKPDGKLVRFSNITLKYKDIRAGNNKSSFPTVVDITASNDNGRLTGTIHFSRKIDYFNINDHLNFFERSFAGSRASVTNYRYIADYNMVYSTAQGSEKLTGRALSEYQDVLPPAKKKRRRRRGRR